MWYKEVPQFGTWDLGPRVPLSLLAPFKNLEANNASSPGQVAQFFRILEHTVKIIPIIQQHACQSYSNRGRFEDKYYGHKSQFEKGFVLVIVLRVGPKIKHAQKSKIFHQNNGVKYGGPIPRFSFFQIEKAKTVNNSNHGIV